MEKLSAKFLKSTSLFWGLISGPLRWLSQFRQSGFEEYSFLPSSAFVYMGCVAGAYLLYVEVSLIATLMTTKQ